MDGPPTEEASHQAETIHQIDELTQAVHDLQRRVEALERRSESSKLQAQSTVEFAAPSALARTEISSGLLGSIGRVLLGIAGAYLLRAITEANLVPQLAGTLVGIAYASGWLVLLRRPMHSSRWTILLQGLAASAILGPLVWEGTLRFHTLTPHVAAGTLAIFILLGQFAAWKRDSSLLGGVIALAGSVTAIALSAGTLDPLPFSAALTLVAAAVEYGACRDRGLTMRWTAAIPADLCAFLLAYLITKPSGLPEGYAPLSVRAVLLILWALLVVYLVSTLLRTLIRKRRIGWIEIAQVVALAALAIWTTVQVAHGSNVAPLAVGIGCLAAAAGAYAASGWKLTRPPGINSVVYSIFALVLTLIGCRLLVSNLVLAALWSALALAATGFGEHWHRSALRIHGILYLAAAAIASGSMTWIPAMAPAVLIGTTSALVYLLMVRSRAGETTTWPERLTSALAAGLSCWSLVGIVGAFAASFSMPAALQSTLRTIVISGLAIALVWLGSRQRLKELIWLLYPWMTFGAVKLMFEDLRQGRSTTSFISLCAFGAALIALPRLLRHAKSSSV